MLLFFLYLIGCDSKNTDSSENLSKTFYFNGIDVQIFDIHCSALHDGRAQTVCFMPNRIGKYQYCHNVAPDYGWTPQSEDPFLDFNDYLEANISDTPVTYSPIKDELQICFEELDPLSFFNLTEEKMIFLTDSVYHEASFVEDGIWSGGAYIGITNPECQAAIDALEWPQLEASLFGEPYQLYGKTPLFRIEHKQTISLDDLNFE